MLKIPVSAFRRGSAFRSRWPAAALAAALLAIPAAASAEAEPGIWDRQRLLGDPGGIRSRMEESGIKIRLTETSTVWANATGGIRRGVVYNGLAELGVELDTGKMGLWQGGLFVASALQIRGRGPSTNLVGAGFNPVATTEATSTTRLYDLYYEQSLFDERLSIRIGQFRADSEFALSQYGPEDDDEDGLPLASATELFQNGTFGFPAIAAAGLPQGGPAYPMGALGIRVKAKPTDNFTLLAAVFNGLTAGQGTMNPQMMNRDGARFPLGDGVTAFLEAQYAVNQGRFGPGLPGMYRIGAWFNNAGVGDVRYDNRGLSLADPASNGTPYRHRATYGFYIGGDQMLWRPDGESKDKGIGVFARIMGSPDNRNPLGFYVNGGMTWKGMFPEREDDVFGLGVAYALVGAASRGFDTDVVAFNPGRFSPTRSAEVVIEATYSYVAAPWWIIKPDIQYVIRPGGGVVNPNDPTQLIGNAFVFGLGTQIKF